MKTRFLSLLFAALLLGACADDEGPPRDAGAGGDGGVDADVGADAGPDASPDASPDVGDGPSENPDVPDEITTEGAEFSGVLEAGQAVPLDVVAEAGDRVVIWLRIDGEESWNPALALYDNGDDPADGDALVWGDPQGETDAHLPYQEDELEAGFEFFDGGRYPLVLENQSEVDGDFAFSLECLGGPCDEGDNGGDGPPDPDEEPYGDLEGDALADKMREIHEYHEGVSYTAAREEMFGEIDNDDGRVECVYTGQQIETDDIPSGTQFNTEHTWPQSRGADSGDPNSDLHHLFPTDSDANSRRGAYHFADVVQNVTWSEGGSKVGDDDTGTTRFEPRDEHKGNVARAMFYFAVVYEGDIPQHEEEDLRDWHQTDPVDAAEEARNEAILQVQNSRNPFIDHPELVERIDDF